MVCWKRPFVLKHRLGVSILQGILSLFQDKTSEVILKPDTRFTMSKLVVQGRFWILNDSKIPPFVCIFLLELKTNA